MENSKYTTREFASIFYVSMRTIQRIRKRSKENIENGVVNVSHRNTKNCERKCIQIDLVQLRNIPLQQRTSVRAATSAMKVSPSLIYSNFRYRNIGKHTNPLKLALTDENKRARVHLRVCTLMRSGLR